MSLINSKVKLKLRWTKHCVLASNGVRNNDADFNNIIFTITTLRITKKYLQDEALPYE